jgi:hypothetical protein
MSVVDPALLVVDKDLVGSVDLSELFVGDLLALRRSTVRMGLECPFLVRSTDCASQQRSSATGMHSLSSGLAS